MLYRLLIAFLLPASLAWGQSATPTADEPLFAEDSLIIEGNGASSFVITTPEEALKHVGELVVIEGPLMGITLKENINGKPLFLDMFSAYPNQPFSLIIFEKNRDKFLPKDSYAGKRVRVSGRLRPPSKEKLAPAIVLYKSSQLQIIN